LTGTAGMSHRRKAVFVNFACGLLCGCQGVTGPRDLGPVPDGPFTTDVTGYVAQRIIEGDGTGMRYRFTVISRFENRGAVPVYLGRCFSTSPQPLFAVRVAGSLTQESGYEQVWACDGNDRQFEILAGDVRIDTLVVVGPNVFNSGSSKGRGITEGQFQLYFDVRLSKGDGAPEAPTAVHFSNAFLVHTEG
jgi:hypothetical protein